MRVVCICLERLFPQGEEASAVVNRTARLAQALQQKLSRSPDQAFSKNLQRADAEVVERLRHIVQSSQVQRGHRTVRPARRVAMNDLVDEATRHLRCTDRRGIDGVGFPVPQYLSVVPSGHRRRALRRDQHVDQIVELVSQLEELHLATVDGQQIDPGTAGLTERIANGRGQFAHVKMPVRRFVVGEREDAELIRILSGDRRR